MITENKGINPAGLYVRVSTMNQLDRESLQTQQDRLEAYCKANAINNFRIYQDAGYSAKDINRPALEALMNDIRKGLIKSVFVIKLDRITRSISDLLRLTNFFNKHAVTFVSISENIDTSTAMGRAMQNLLGIFAQLEREVTAERVATDMRYRAGRGRWNGGVVPFGYTTQKLLKDKYRAHGIDPNTAIKICPEAKKLFIEPEEQEIVKWIYKTFLETNSIRKTTRKLNDRGLKTRKGDFWSSTTIHRILSNPTYTGKIWYGKRKTDPVSGRLIKQDTNDWMIVDGEHEPIIPDKTFEEVLRLLSKNKGKPTRAKRTYILSGILRCNHCGGILTGHSYMKKTTSKTYSYYRCLKRVQKGETACTGVSLPAQELEDFVIEKLFNLSKNKTFLTDKKKMIELYKLKINENVDFKSETKRIDKQHYELTKRMDILLGKLERELISDDDFQRRYQKLKAELENLEQAKVKIQSLSISRRQALKNLEVSFNEIDNFNNNWDYLDDTGKVLRIRSIVKEVRVEKKKIDIDIFLDVADLSRTDTDSLPQSA